MVVAVAVVVVVVVVEVVVVVVEVVVISLANKASYHLTCKGWVGGWGGGGEREIATD